MCGFPNNVSDTQCKRCHTSLQNVVRTRTISRPVTISSASDLTTPSSTMETPPDLNQILEQKKSTLVNAQENKSDWRYRNAAFFVLFFLFGLFLPRKAYVFVSSFTQNAVQEYLDAREDRKPYLLISHGRGRRGSADILSREKYGTPLPEHAAHRIVKAIGRRAFPRGGAGFVGPHAFRHWHGQRLRLMGVPIDQIHAILGHSSPAVTEQNYAPLPSREVIGRIERKLQS